MREKVYIEIDASPWMDAGGVDTTVYIGDTDEPAYSEVTSFEDLVDKELQAHTVHGKLTNEYGHDNITPAEEFVVALEQTALYARKRFEDLLVVDD